MSGLMCDILRRFTGGGEGRGKGSMGVEWYRVKEEENGGGVEAEEGGVYGRYGWMNGRR